MAFSLDTSGSVRLLAKDAPWKGLPKPDIYWSDLTPFAQGYFTAAAQELYERLVAEGRTPEEAAEAVAFGNWSGEALALVLRDCERRQAGLSFDPSREDGALFWRQRTARPHAKWPPLTVSLSEDGNVCLDLPA